MAIDFEFDEDKDIINREKHGLPLALAMQIFERDHSEREDARIDYDEARLVATGPIAALDDRICVVVYTWRGTRRRLISFRRANDKEIDQYRRSNP